VLDRKESKITRYPPIYAHHSEFKGYVELLKVDQIKVTTTQSLEFIDVLLESDLDFEVVTVKRVNDEIRSRTLSKEDVAANRKAWAFDPRD
jgi:hypothetical protein